MARKWWMPDDAEMPMVWLVVLFAMIAAFALVAHYTVGPGSW